MINIDKSGANHTIGNGERKITKDKGWNIPRS